MRAQALSLALWLGLSSIPALACGHCIEDRIAAVYDHALTSRTLARGHHIVFLGIDGPLPASSERRLKIERTVAGTRGIDAGSVRVSLEAAALSLSFDPARESWPQLLQALQSRLALQGLTLQPLRVMERSPLH